MVTNERNDIGDESNDPLDDVGFACTRLTASLKGILRRSQLVDVGANKFTASTTGAWGERGVFSESTRFGSVWFVFLLILQVSCKISGEE